MSQGALVSYIVLGLLASGVIIALLASRRDAFRDTERSKYEMLGIQPEVLPEASAPSSGKTNEGAEDRIVRFALAVVTFYFAFARLGMPSLGAIVLLTAGVYLTLTALMGFDPVYRLMRWDTRLPEHRDRL